MICPNCQQSALMLIKGVCPSCAAKPVRARKKPLTPSKAAHGPRRAVKRRSGACKRARCCTCNKLVRVSRGRYFMHLDGGVACGGSRKPIDTAGESG